VVSFNGATSLILGSEFHTQGSHEFLVIAISFRTARVPLERPGTSRQWGARSPLVLTYQLDTLSDFQIDFGRPGFIVSGARQTKAF
jgi:hypothetical protein